MRLCVCVCFACVGVSFQQAWLGEPPNRTSEALFSSLALLMERFQQARARVGGPLKAV